MAGVSEEHQVAPYFFSIKSEVKSGRTTRVALEKVRGSSQDPGSSGKEPSGWRYACLEHGMLLL